MAKRFGEFFVTLLLLVICVGSSVSALSPESAPSPGPAPAHGADSPTAPVSSPLNAGAPTPVTHPPILSPPSPPPETHSPGSSPTPSPPSPSPSTEKSPVSPVPSPSPDAGDTNDSDMNANGEESEGSSGGMSGGKKAGIAVGVIAAACLVGLGGLVYKKRRDNIRRSQYSYTARREIL